MKSKLDSIIWPICPEDGSTVLYERISLDGKIELKGRNKVCGFYLFGNCVINGKILQEYFGASFSGSHFMEKDIWLVDEYCSLLIVEKVWKM